MLAIEGGGRGGDFRLGEIVGQAQLRDQRVGARRDAARQVARLECGQYLLVDDDVHQRTRGSNALVGTDEVFERQRTDKFLGIRLTSGPLSARYTTYITKKKVPSNEFTQLVVIKE